MTTARGAHREAGTIRMGGGTPRQSRRRGGRRAARTRCRTSWPSPTACARRSGTARATIDFSSTTRRSSSPREDHLCGLNYKSHILEMGTRCRVPDAVLQVLVGSSAQRRADPAAASEQMDWRSSWPSSSGARPPARGRASAHRGYATLNDVTARDFQNRTSQCCRQVLRGDHPLGRGW